MDIITLILGGLLGFIIGAFMMRIIANQEHKKIRKHAVKGSRNNIFGEVYEKILPALPNFPFAPKDMVFIGKGCDYIIFDGLSQGKLREIVFLELKSGNAVLNANEKAVRSIIANGRTRFSEYRIDSTKYKK